MHLSLMRFSIFMLRDVKKKKIIIEMLQKREEEEI